MEHINFILWEVFVVKETWMRRMPALLAGLVLTLSLARLFTGIWAAQRLPFSCTQNDRTVLRFPI